MDQNPPCDSVAQRALRHEYTIAYGLSGLSGGAIGVLIGVLIGYLVWA